MDQRTCERCGRTNDRPRAPICTRCKKSLDNAKARGTIAPEPFDNFDCAWCGKNCTRGADVPPHAAKFCSPEHKKLWHYANVQGPKLREIRAQQRCARALDEWLATPDPNPLSFDLAREASAFGAALLRDPCSYCGVIGGNVDHIDPTSRGGEDDWTNWTGTCHRCNGRKSATPLLLFLGWDRASREFEPWREAVGSLYREDHARRAA